MIGKIFRLHIECENSAFSEFPEEEISRILREVADRIDRHGETFHHQRDIRDVNGNVVGGFRLAQESDR